MGVEIGKLIEALSRPEAYPHDRDDFAVHQTHISVVFLAGSCAYKVKKPVDLGFVDFTTLERRRFFCEEEVRLNRRLAEDVYLGVVPIVEAGEWLAVDGDGPAVEWAVKMRRLPADATFLDILERGDLDPAAVERLAVRIAAFHEAAESSREIGRFGRLDVVAGNARENLEQSRPHVGVTVSETVFRRLSERLETCLEEIRPVVDRRAGAGVPRDTHGDLHLDHVYLLPDRTPPRDLVVIDCVEFADRFRWADPVADAAFLVMDLLYHGRGDLADRFADVYFAAAGDDEGRRLLPFYVSYRAAVRGKVEGMVTEEEEVPPEERAVAVERARGHWLLALSALEAPDRRPGLVLLAGLPGTGKSTLAGALEREAGFHGLSSDRVRKRLAGVAPDAAARAAWEEGIYAPEWTERVYGELLRRTGEILFEGGRVVIDASFREERWRRAFIDLAARLRVPTLVLECSVAPEIALDRLDGPREGPSDADRRVYERAREAWQEPGPETLRTWRTVDTARDLAATTREALAGLREIGLL